jgi:DNA replication protein DnaC
MTHSLENQQRLKSDLVKSFVHKLPPKFEHADLKNVNPEILKHLKNYIVNKEYLDGKNIMLQGGFGVGKTYIAFAIVKQIVEDMAKEYKNISWEFMILSDLGVDFKNAELSIEKAKNCNILIFDDIFEEQMNKYTSLKFYNLVNYRYNNNLPTIFTTNMDLKTMKEVVSERVADRIRENLKLIILKGESKRGDLNE